MSNTALLIIDVQYGVFARKEYDGVAVYNEDTLLDNLEGLIQRARAANVAVIYIQHLYENMPIMEKGSPLWEVHPRIRPEPGDRVVEKRHADSFFDTGLEDMLKEMGITRLILTGLQTEYCVDTTCRRAHSLGYDNILVSDGHSTYDSEIISAEKIVAHHNEVLASQFVTLQTAGEVEM